MVGRHDPLLQRRWLYTILKLQRFRLPTTLLGDKLVGVLLFHDFDFHLGKRATNDILLLVVNT
jgi:hypothetical protein